MVLQFLAQYFFKVLLFKFILKGFKVDSYTVILYNL